MSKLVESHQAAMSAEIEQEVAEADPMPAWRDSQEWAAGAVGLASAIRSITGERLDKENR